MKEIKKINLESDSQEMKNGFERKLNDIMKQYLATNGLEHFRNAVIGFTSQSVVQPPKYKAT